MSMFDVISSSRRRFSVAYRAAVLADSPVAYWRLGEASGTTAADETGSYNGAYIGSPTLGVAGPISGRTARSVSGSQYMRVPYAAPLAPTVAVTSAVWALKPAWTGSSQGIGPNKTNAGAYGLWLSLASTDRVSFYCYRNGSYGIATAPALLAPGWHYLVGSFDGRYTRLYVDGFLVATNDGGSSFPIYYADLNSLMVGADPDATINPQFPFIGVLAEAAVYSVALSPARILAHYNAAGY